MISRIETVRSQGKEWVAEQQVLRLPDEDYQIWMRSVLRKGRFIRAQETVFLLSIVVCGAYFLSGTERHMLTAVIAAGILLANIATFVLVGRELRQELRVREEIFNRNFPDIQEEDFGTGWLNAATQEEMGKYGQRRYLILPVK